MAKKQPANVKPAPTPLTTAEPPSPTPTPLATAEPLSPIPTPLATAEPPSPAPLESKPWTFLLYFCGDTSSLKEAVQQDVAEVASACKVGLDQVHVILQHDSPDRGARRYVGSGGQWLPQNEKEPVRVNTGDPQEAIDFITWGLKYAPSRHVAVFFSGQGIRRKYADEIRKQRDIFERFKPATGDKQDRSFRATDLFSICHDESHHDALDVAELQHILQAAKTLLDRPVDLVVFDAGCTAFFEIAYQLRSVARVMMAPRGPMPDAGLPYDKLLVNCNQFLQKIDSLERARIVKVDLAAKVPPKSRPERAAICLSRVIGRTTANTKFVATEKATEPVGGDLQHAAAADAVQHEEAPELVVIDLQHAVAAAQHIDYVAGTLQSHLGDWHVLNAVRRTGVFVNLMQSLVRARKPKDEKGAKEEKETKAEKKDLADLPTVDLFRFLCLLEAHFEREELRTPANFGQLTRLQHVRRVVRCARQELVPQRYLDAVHLWLNELADNLNEAGLPKFSDESKAKWNAADIEKNLKYVRRIAGWFDGAHSQDKDLIRIWRRTYSPTPRGCEDLSRDRQGVLVTPCESPLPDGRGSKSSQPPSFGLSILLPQAHDLDTDSTKTSDDGVIRGSNYNSLDFCRDVGWTTYLGALQLILEKPHALWRMITSFLFSQNEQTRNSTLQRFLESGNVLSGISEQFRGFRSGLALTLSLDVDSIESTSQGVEEECTVCRGTADREEFTLRLQGADGSPRIQENTSPIYRSTTENALRSFELLLNSDAPVEEAMTVLRQLGRALGEDIIQDLGESLSEERQKLVNDTSVAPHLRLQIPMHLMRYPWELMSDKQGLLFERFAMGRQFFTRSRLPMSRPRQETALRVLVLGDPKFDDSFWESSNPKQLPGAVREAKHEDKIRKKSKPNQLPGAVKEAQHVVDLFREIREDLEGIVEVWIEEHIGCVITVNQVRELLRSERYDIIHYAGHACFNPDDPEGSAWLLSDGLLHAREIRNTLQWTLSPPWLVYANACEAGMEGGDSVCSDGLRHYQGDVCGLGSAFTNHGVRGYLAPLWPINDDVALQIATDFYRGLLINRFTLGEALFKAKQDAKHRLLGIDGQAQGSMLPAQVALSWASLVLYGDPSQGLFQSLWSGAASAQEIVPEQSANPPDDHFERRSPNNWKPDQTRRRFMPRIQQASARSIVNEMNGLGLTSGDAPRVRGANGELAPQHKAVELVEINGLRFWQVVDPITGKKSSLPGSNLKSQIESQELKDRLGCNRGLFDYVRVIGKWAVNLVTFTPQDPLELQLARQFDKGIVPQERLVEVREDSTLTTLRPGQWKALGDHDRVILIIHGTFSQAKSPVDGFDFDAEKKPSKFFRDLTAAWAKQHKDDPLSPKLRVIAYDHWTLSKSPLDNAADMAKALYDLDPKLLDKDRLDLMVHSRGGLVARSFVELDFEAAQEKIFEFNPEKRASEAETKAAKKRKDACSVAMRCAAVRRVIFIGTPNAGTQLANPVNAGRLADFLVNLAHLDEFGFFARMSGLLAQVVVHDELGKIPGLRAQNPNHRDKPGELLYRLHWETTTIFENNFMNDEDKDDPKKRKDSTINAEQKKKYWCVAANYEPFDDKGATDLTGIGEHLKAVGLDEAFDAFYNVTNDLVVDTHGVWAFRNESQQMLKTTGDLPSSQVLLYNPTPAVTQEPPDAQRVRAVRVHHCNLFMKREVRQFVKDIVLEK